MSDSDRLDSAHGLSRILASTATSQTAFTTMSSLIPALLVLGSLGLASASTAAAVPIGCWSGMFTPSNVVASDSNIDYQTNADCQVRAAPNAGDSGTPSSQSSRWVAQLAHSAGSNTARATRRVTGDRSPTHTSLKAAPQSPARARKPRATPIGARPLRTQTCFVIPGNGR
jgi:hypothetical protein